jgi:hypothetical protein
MINSQRWSPGAPGRIHPAVRDRRIRDVGRVGLSVVVPTVLALAITAELPSRDLGMVLGAIVAVLAVVALMLSSRLEVTVTLLAIYLGTLDGPVKLLFGAHEETASIPNVLVLAVCLGAVMRIIVHKQPMRLPPLSGWVLAFVGVVVVEAFNPKTAGALKVVAGFRQQLQFVPFFFFGFYLLRSKRRFRQLFIIVGVIAAANGLVAAYQTELSPAQLASWGPGYHNLIYVPEEKSGTGRVYVSEGEARVRPPGLGSDAGFSGDTGEIALPFCLALLATSRRRKWVAALLCLGALVAVMAGLSRAQVVGAGLGVVAFAGLSVLAGRRVTRVLGALLVIGVLAIPVGALVVTSLRSGTFKRYESISPTSSSTTLHKEGAWELIPHYLSVAPFGFGLGSVGSVASVGGKDKQLLEGHGVSSETQYNLIVNELGAPGLVVWVALSLFMLLLIVRGMRKVREGELAIMLAGVFAPFISLFLEGTSGAFTDSAFAGPYFWLSIGVAAYWFVGPGRELARHREPKLARSSSGGVNARLALS